MSIGSPQFFQCLSVGKTSVELDQQQSGESVMTKRIWASTILGALALVMIFSSALVAQRTRTRPATPATTAPRTDLKITYRTSVMGQSREDTTMLKGARERSEMK